jgi:hypothetical protein
MAQGKDVQLAQLVDSNDPASVLEQALRIFTFHYAEELSIKIHLAFEQVRRLFEGDFPGYRACLAEYHDLRHTLQVFLTTARLLDGYNLERVFLPESLALSLLQAALLHDTGYIQEEWDTEGTGARYGRQHEQRSVEFVRRHGEVFEIEDQDQLIVTRMIQSTDLKQEFSALPFGSAEERSAASLLASADLLGQMADREYLEKLLFLYYEFREAGVPGYDTEFDILRKTREFYGTIRDRLEVAYLGAYRLVQAHFRERIGRDENLYMVAIERQMEYLDKIIADNTTNFRAKLRRGDRAKRQRYSRRR